MFVWFILNLTLGQYWAAVVSRVPSEQEGPGFNSRLEAFLCGVCMFFLSWTWDLSRGCSCLSPGLIRNELLAGWMDGSTTILNPQIGTVYDLYRKWHWNIMQMSLHKTTVNWFSERSDVETDQQMTEKHCLWSLKLTTSIPEFIFNWFIICSHSGSI